MERMDDYGERTTIKDYLSIHPIYIGKWTVDTSLILHSLNRMPDTYKT